jgi:hypothetical protein
MLDTVNEVIDHLERVDIQQGGVRYLAVSHCRTRMLLTAHQCVVVPLWTKTLYDWCLGCVGMLKGH